MKRRGRPDWQRLFDEFLRQAAPAKPISTADTGRQSSEDERPSDHRDLLRPRGFVMPEWFDPEPRTPSKKKPTKPRGAPREYDYDAVRGVAESYLENEGLPRSNELFMEKVEAALKANGILVPRQTLMKKLTAPIFKKAKRRAHKLKKSRIR